MKKTALELASASKLRAASASMAVVFIAITLSFVCGADEGLYTFDNPPLTLWKTKYGFQPEEWWLRKAMSAAVRFNNGGSGSFVSGNGLVMTNHHVGFSCIQKLSTSEKDYVKDGFIAREQKDEIPCHDLELNVLVSFEDVTFRVTKAATSAKDPAEAGKLRKAEIARIENECNETTGLRCEVTSFYGGGQYMLHRYRRHTDVRLVFAPEQQIAFFGGDPDNFTYPRFDLDVAFFRVYENGVPYRPEHYFTWSPNGPSEGELVFVIGNPGTTARQLTVAQLEFERDVRTPNRLRSFALLLDALKKYAAQSEENLRQSKELIFGVENAIKAYKGFDKGLKDPAVMAAKVEEEKRLREEVKKRPDLEKEVGGALERIAAAQKEHAEFHVAHYIVQAAMRRSDLLRWGVTVVQLAVERKKPNEERLEEYRDSALDSLLLDLFSAAPVYKGLEKTILATSLEEAVSVLGKDDPFVKAALGDRTVKEVVDEVVDGTKLDDLALRKKLVRDGEKWKLKKWNKEMKKTKDPLLRLALRIDPILRQLRKRYEDKVESVEKTEGAKIANARFKIYGKNEPPDATFTLRISFGVVKGYEAEGTVVPWKTNFYGLYARSSAFDGAPPFDLPPRWIEKEKALDLSVPFNFVSTVDIVGGNSGSPVINAKGEIVGLIFDGNIHSKLLRYHYTEEKARAIAVHSSGIREALLKVYEAHTLAKELGKGP